MLKRPVYINSLVMFVISTADGIEYLGNTGSWYRSHGMSWKLEIDHQTNEELDEILKEFKCSD